MLVVVPYTPPHESLIPSPLYEDTDLSPSAATDLYRAMAADVCRAVAASGGDLLINYRDEDTLPADVAETVEDPEAEARALVVDALGDAEDVRIERQVGSSRSARVGNTVTHLLEREDVGTVGVLEPTAALVGRTEIDGVAMSLRRHDVIIGPSQGGDVYLAAFSEPIDFTDVYDETPVAAVATRAQEDGLDVGFAPRVPTVTDESGLMGTSAEVVARRVANRPVATLTGALFEELGVLESR